MTFAIWGGSFLEPDPFSYFFGYGFLAGFVGYFVARRVRAAWARLHAKLDVHTESHEELHVKLDRLLGVNEPKPKPPSDYTGKAPSE